MTTIAPYLPKEGDYIAKEWERQGKLALVLGYERSEGECPNCGGLSFVILKRCADGPYQAPAQYGVSTWYDGDGQHGQGWYNVFDTFRYDCPECKKRVKPNKPYVLPPQGAIEQVAKMLGKKEALDENIDSM